MFTATTSTLAAAAVLAGGAVIGTSAPGPADPAPGASVSETQRQEAGTGNHDHPDMAQMAQMHERMMADHPEMVQVHERVMSDHPEMERMHEQMMGGTGGGMMGGDSGMGMQ